MSVYQKLMGSTWVYDRVRPLVLGGFDFSQVYSWLECTGEDVVLDVGCGTGHAFQYIKSFRSYHGFDIDGAALAELRRKHGRPELHTHERILQARDLEQIRPDKVIAMGLLHHLSEEQATELLQMLRACPSVRRIITLDPVLVKGKWSSNLLARMDRGRFVRREAGYRALAGACGWAPRTAQLLHSGNKLAWYFATCLTPALSGEPASVGA
jgi:SAM-dependent methyltransferase